MESMPRMAMEIMTRTGMEAMPRGAMEVMAWVASEVMAWVASEVMAWVASEDMAWVATGDMAWVALEVMAREALEKAFGLHTASPTTVLDLMANLKATVSSLLPMASNLKLLILPRIAKHNSRSHLPNISHPNSSLSLPSHLPTSSLVTLDNLPMDMVSSLPTLKAPGSASSPVPGYDYVFKDGQSV